MPQKRFGSYLKNRWIKKDVWLSLLVVTVGYVMACELQDPKPITITSPSDSTEYSGGEDITFTALIDNFEGTVSKTKWDFGDGISASGLTTVHAYDQKGTYTVSFTATNEYGDRASDTIKVMITSYRFTKINDIGQDLPDNTTSWSSVRDRMSGLIWEVKQNRDDTTDYDNPHDADNLYTWYDSNSETNGGDAGSDGDGTDTEDLINQLNEEIFGGFADWRMPTCDELKTILDPQRFNPAINTDYFPETVPWYYWASTTYEKFPYAACHIYFLGNPPVAMRTAIIRSQNHYGDKDLFYHARAVSDGKAVTLWQGNETVYVKKDSETVIVALKGQKALIFEGKEVVRLSDVIEKAAIVENPGKYFYTFYATDNYSLEMALLNEDFGTGFPPWGDMQKGYFYQTHSNHYGLMVYWEDDTIGGRIHHCYDVRLMDGGTIELREEDIVSPNKKHCFLVR